MILPPGLLVPRKKPWVSQDAVDRMVSLLKLRVAESFGVVQKVMCCLTLENLTRPHD